MRLNELEKTGLNITRKAMKIQLSGVKKGRSDANTEGCPPTKKSRSQKSTPEIIWEGVYGVQNILNSCVDYRAKYN